MYKKEKYIIKLVEKEFKSFLKCVTAKYCV